jgi:hypothetical protein
LNYLPRGSPFQCCTPGSLRASAWRLLASGFATGTFFVCNPAFFTAGRPRLAIARPPRLATVRHPHSPAHDRIDCHLTIAPCKRRTLRVIYFENVLPKYNRGAIVAMQKLCGIPCPLRLSDGTLTPKRSRGRQQPGASISINQFRLATSADGKRIHQGVTIIITRYSINSPPPAGVALFPRKGGERQIHVANADLCISSSPCAPDRTGGCVGSMNNPGMVLPPFNGTPGHVA